MAEYHVQNFGCRASQADGQAIAASLDQLGHTGNADLASADVLILNTCAVTAEAERDARAFLRRARRANPSLRVLVTGCYAQRAPEEVSALPGVQAVVGNSHKAQVAAETTALLGLPVLSRTANNTGFVPLDSLRAHPPAPRTLVDHTFAHADLFLSGWAGEQEHTRPTLKVQDGCGNRCSFCIIPETRGSSRSIPLARVLEAARAFTEAGGQEMVLSGINLGRWGRDLEQPQSLPDLVESILTATRLPRLRLSSVEPMDYTARLLELFSAFAGGETPRLSRHAHLPLQSGSDTILRRMFRRYRPWHYAEKTAALRTAMPDAAIGADVMVGFPGETDPLFEESLRFIEAQPFTYLHLFPFSARLGTAAWRLQQHAPVPLQAVRERLQRLQQLAEARQLGFRSRFVGRVLTAITLRKQAMLDGVAITHALTDNFLCVAIPGAHAHNRMLRVSVEEAASPLLRCRVEQRFG